MGRAVSFSPVSSQYSLLNNASGNSSFLMFGRAAVVPVDLMWIPCSRNQQAYSYCRTPATFVSGNHARGSREIVMSRTRHGAFSPTFRRWILRGGYTAWRILRGWTQEGPAGWSFDPSAEGATTTARPPLSLLICPCLSFCHRTALSSCCHTLQPL